MSFQEISILKLGGVEAFTFPISAFYFRLEGSVFICWITDFCALNLNKSYIFHNSLAGNCLAE